jgi:hypothetical protein
LATLGELFRDGDPVVAADHEGYYLGFAAPDRLIDNGSRLNEVASSLLRRVNGVGACAPQPSRAASWQQSRSVTAVADRRGS